MRVNTIFRSPETVGSTDQVRVLDMFLLPSDIQLEPEPYRNSTDPAPEPDFVPVNCIADISEYDTGDVALDDPEFNPYLPDARAPFKSIPATFVQFPLSVVQFPLIV